MSVENERDSVVVPVKLYTKASAPNAEQSCPKQRLHRAQSAPTATSRTPLAQNSVRTAEQSCLPLLSRRLPPKQETKPLCSNGTKSCPNSPNGASAAVITKLSATKKTTSLFQPISAATILPQDRRLTATENILYKTAFISIEQDGWNLRHTTHLQHALGIETDSVITLAAFQLIQNR